MYWLFLWLLEFAITKDLRSRRCETGGPTQTLLPPSPLTLLNSPQSVHDLRHSSVGTPQAQLDTNQETGNLTSDANSSITALNKHRTCVQPCTKGWKRVNGKVSSLSSSSRSSVCWAHKQGGKRDVRGKEHQSSERNTREREVEWWREWCGVLVKGWLDSEIYQVTPKIRPWTQTIKTGLKCSSWLLH